MRPLIQATLLYLAFVVLPGCMQIRAPVRLPMGGLFTSHTAPLTVNLHETPALPIAIGKASTTVVVIPIFGRWDFAFGDATIDQAAENGGLSTVYYADYKLTSVLGIFGRFETIVYGE